MFRRAALIIAMILVLSACKETLNSGLSENEANQILSTLLDYNIQADKQVAKDGTLEILVERSQFAYSVNLLESFGLPRKKFSDVSQVFNKDGLISSPTKEWAQLNYAHTQELAAMVSAIPGVISAKVQIANPRQTNPFDKKVEPNVAVLVLVREGNITPELVPQIKLLVSNGVENVSYEHIGVVLSQVKPPSRPKVSLTNLGGLEIADGLVPTAYRLAAIIGALGILIGAAITFIVWFVWKRKAKR